PNLSSLSSNYEPAKRSRRQSQRQTDELAETEDPFPVKRSRIIATIGPEISGHGCRPDREGIPVPMVCCGPAAGRLPDPTRLSDPRGSPGLSPAAAAPPPGPLAVYG